MQRFTFLTTSPEETEALGRRLGEILAPPALLLLRGDLGAGKTTFVQGLGFALGLKRPLTSPTFTVCTEHRTASFTLVHMDLYRLNGPDDLLTIGYPEYLETGAVVAVEWPERAGELIPPDALHVRVSLTDDPETRVIVVSRGDGP